MTYYWRLFATGLSYSVFGLGGFLLWVFVFPILSLIPSSQQQKMLRAQKSVHYSFYFFIGVMHKLGVLTYEINGVDKLNRPGQLIIANHPTLIDIVFLISRIPQAKCIVKGKLWHNPFTKGPIIHAGYISNEDPEKMIDDCVSSLKSGGIIIVFPEGTRTELATEFSFQRSAAHIALKSQARVIPVILSCHPSTLGKTEKWYQIPGRPFHLAMSVGNAMVLDDFFNIQPRSIAARHLNRYLQNYFNKQCKWI